MAVEKIWLGLLITFGALALFFAGSSGLPTWTNNLRNPFLACFATACLFGLFSRRFRSLLARSIRHPETLLTEEKEKPWLLGMSAFYLLFYLKVSYFNFLSFHVEAIDFSIFDFMLANTARGRFMESVWGTNHFGTHFTPILFLLYPWHRLFTHPFVLLFAHPIILWSAVLPLYWLARDHVRAPFQRLLVIFAFFNFNYVAQILSYNFHIEVFYVPGFFWFFWALEHRRWTWLTITTLLLLSIKEDAAIYLAAAAVGIPFSFSVPWVVPLLLFLVSTSLFVLNMKWIIPSFAGTSSYRVADAAAAYGHTLSEILPNMAARWREILRDVLLGKWLSMASAFLFLPLLVPFVLIAMLPFAVIHVLASSHVMKNLMLYYSAPYVPFLFFGFLYCLSRERLPVVRWPFPLWAKSLAIWFTVLHLSLTGGSYLSVYSPHPEQRWLGEVRRHLRLTEPLCVQGVLVPHIGYPERMRLLGPSCVVDKPTQVLLHPGLSPFPYSSEEFRDLRGRFAQDPSYVKQAFGGFEIYTRN